MFVFIILREYSNEFLGCTVDFFRLIGLEIVMVLLAELMVAFGEVFEASLILSPGYHTDMYMTVLPA
jgi:hypothetical protein